MTSMAADDTVAIVEVTKIELGASASDGETLSKIKRVVITKIPQRHQPRTAMGTVNPIGWQKPHKHVTFEIHTQSDVYSAIYHNGSGNVAYDSFTADNPALPYCKFTLKDAAGTSWTCSLTGAIVDGVAHNINDGEDILTVVYISAYSMGALTK